MSSGGFDAYAVSSDAGPHVTLQAGVVHLGRHWTTTTRHSAKAASIRATRRASATIGAGQRWRVVGGKATVLDPAHPCSLAGDPVATTFAGGAVLRLGVGRLDQLLGYFQAGTAVPASFLPPGRVLLVTRVTDELVLDGDEVSGAAGAWDRAPIDLIPGPRPDRRQDTERALADVPDEIAELAGTAGPAWLGVGTPSGAVALPAAWDPTASRLRVSRGALASVAARLPGPICLTIHESDSRRPDEKMGAMLRGEGALVDVDATSAWVALETERVTYWCGFATTTSDRAA